MANNNLALSIVLQAKDLATSAINALRNSIHSVGNESSSASAEAQAFARSQDTASSSVSGFTASLRSSLLQLGAFAAGLIGLKSAAEGIKSVLNTGGEFEKLGVQMAAVTGGSRQGEQALAWVKKFAADTPFEVQGVANAFVKLKAFGLDPMDGTLQAIADQTAKLGGGQAELEGIVLALGQAWTKQKLQAEEANQLIERGVPVWDLLAKATGKTTAELADLAAKGELGRNTIKLLIDEIGKSSAGSSASMMKTWGGLVSNLSDSWTAFLDRVAQSGALDYFKQQLKGLLDQVAAMAENGQLQQFARNVSDSIVGIASVIKVAVVAVAQLTVYFKELTFAILGIKFAGMIEALRGGVVGAFGAASTAATAFAGVLTTIKTLAGGALYGLLIEKTLEVISVYMKLREQYKLQEEAEQNRDKNLGKISERLAEISQRTGVTVASMEELNAAIDDGVLVYDRATNSYVRAGDAIDAYNEKAAKAAASQGTLADAIGNGATDAAKQTENAGKLLLDGINQNNKSREQGNQETLKKILAQEIDHLKKVNDLTKQGLDVRLQMQKGLAEINNSGNTENAFNQQQMALLEAERAMRAGNYQEAIQQYQSIADAAKQSAIAESQAIQQGGGSYLDKIAYTGQYEQALKSIIQITQLQSQQEQRQATDAQQQYQDVKNSVAQLSTAVTDLNKGVTINIDGSQINQSIASVLQLQNELAKAAQAAAALSAQSINIGGQSTADGLAAAALAGGR